MLPRSTLLLSLLALVACRAADAPRKPEGACIEACRARVSHLCTDNECARGCRLSLDRLVEKEGDHVLACVASAKNRRCDDFLWADCAARIGAHADGGPPAPPPAKEDFDEED